jgi:C_GCAxxG_C_C family probable redox protein
MSIDSAEEKSRGYFDADWCCAEAVLLAMSEEFGAKSKLLPRIATGFCGGLSRTDGTCGALTGAILAFGLLFGRDDPKDDRDLITQMAQRLARSFGSRWGSTQCTHVCGHDLSTEAGRAAANNDPRKHERCRDVVGATTRAAAELAEIGLSRR